MLVKKLPHACEANPEYASDGAAAIDLHAAINGGDVTLRPGEWLDVPTGIMIALQSGQAAQIWPRSGLAVKYGIGILAGLIDSDYRGEVKAVLINNGPMPWTFKRGDRIAQLLIVSYSKERLEIVEALPDSRRGSAGFGSTGQ